MSPSDHSGIGIDKFLEGKNYFVTGATGFLGKVLVEKMWRSSPNVGKLFLLIKEDNQAAIDRLKNEILKADLFDRLKQIHGNSYEKFVMSKLIPVAGDVGEANLGMDVDIEREVIDEVDIFINSAADTTLDQRYDIVFNTNTRGPERVLNLAKKYKKVVVFLHFSSAFANGERQGKVMEKPFFMRSNSLDVNTEMKFIHDVIKSSQSHELTQKLKEMGMKKAKAFGWRNTYEMTKAMGEMLISEQRGEMPIVILRPSVITSSYVDPFPGWLQGYGTLNPMILLYGRGKLPGFLGDPHIIFDLIPVDMVVNATIVAMAKHGITRRPELSVYHLTSSAANPTYYELMEFAYHNFTSNPLKDSNGNQIRISKFKFVGSFHCFYSYIRNVIAQRSGGGDKISRVDLKMVKSLIHMARLYQPYGFNYGRFDNENTKKLMREMSVEEEKRFQFGIENINWRDYIIDIHIPGLRRHVLRNTGATYLHKSNL